MKKYEAPICEILKFGEEDILTASAGYRNGETKVVGFGGISDLDITTP